MASAAASTGVPLEILPAQVLRNLSDRSFDKRKAGAQEVEKVIRKLKAEGAQTTIKKLLSLLASDYACSVNSNNRKGGLIALASAAIGLGSSTGEHLETIVPPVLKSFNDAENRVRYYACESLFNIAKLCRGAILRYFSEIFIGVCKLVADSDVDVKNGAGLLDRLLKEIVLESEALDIERFVPLLRAHMGVINPYVRQLLVGWITTLDSVPGIDMVDHMPDLLEGLFDMLSDGNREIRQQAYGALSNFLDQISKVPANEFEARVAFRPMVDTLISQTVRDRDKFNRVTAVEWLTQFSLLGQSKLAPVYDRLIGAVLRCLSDPENEIVAEAAKTNNELMALVRSTPVRDFEAVIPAIIRTITAEGRSKDRVTRSAALRWVAMMLALSPDRVMLGVDELLAALLANLLDSDDPEVLRLNLEVLARLSVYNLTFLKTRVLKDLIQLFAENRPLLEAKGAFILRRLCLLLDARVIYLSMARLLVTSTNREFSSLLVELLNLILLTAVELTDLRDLLRGCAAPDATRGSSLTDAGATGTGSSGSNKSAVPQPITAALIDDLSDPTDSVGVFLVLYRTWCVNPVASFSLCLLAQAYELGASIITRFAETTISVGVLMQLDKLVQLLETPIFLQTRLHLTRPERPDHQFLLRSLYGVLMMMPQGTAFVTLRDRLHCLSALHLSLAQAPTQATPSRWNTIDLTGAFDIFAEYQRRQRELLTADLRSRSVLHRYNQMQASVGADGAVKSSSAALTESGGGVLATTPLASLGLLDAGGVVAGGVISGEVVSEGDESDGGGVASGATGGIGSSGPTLRELLRGDGTAPATTSGGDGNDGGLAAAPSTPLLLEASDTHSESGDDKSSDEE